MNEGFPKYQLSYFLENGMQVVFRTNDYTEFVQESDRLRLVFIPKGEKSVTQAPTVAQRTIAGTPYYMAPEVQEGEKRHYDSKVDCWSMGVLLYVFMSGYLPFQAENRADVFKKIRNG